DLAAAGQGGAVDGGYEGFGPLSAGDAAEAAPFCLQFGRAAGGDDLQIGPGGEDGTLSCDHARPHLGIVLETVDARLHAPRHVAVDGVPSLGTADGENGDAAPLLIADGTHYADSCSFWWPF